MGTVKTHETSTSLREAMQTGMLSHWTQALTGIVLGAFVEIGCVVRHLTEEVVQSMELPSRSGLGGETLIIVGSRSETATFPYGFFKDWTLDANTARFRRH